MLGSERRHAIFVDGMCTATPISIAREDACNFFPDHYAAQVTRGPKLILMGG